MKIYDFSKGKLRKGIAVERRVLARGVKILAVVLGNGRYGRELWVAVQNPPQTGQLQHAVTGKTRSGKANLIGIDADQGDSAVIVRINTDRGYRKNTHGRCETIKGNPETIVSTSAPTSSSRDVRLGSYFDGLVKMWPGDVIKVTLSSGHNAKPYALHFDAQGQLTVSLFEDWQAGSVA